MIKRAEKYLELIEQRIKEYRILGDNLYRAKEDYRQNPSFENKLRLEALIAYFEKFELSKFSQIPEKEYELNKENLTVYIDKNWRAFEFDRIFKGLDFLNKLYTVEHKLRSRESRMFKGESRRYIYERAKLYHYLAPFEELKVTKIQYASPGLINFKGSEKIVSKILSFVEKVITFEFARKVVDNYDYYKHKRPLNIQNDKNDLRKAIKKTEVEVIEEETRKLQAENNLEEEKYNRQKRKIERIKELFNEFLEISELIDKLDERRIAKKEILERQLISVVGSLHNLGFETEKIKVIKEENEDGG